MAEAGVDRARLAALVGSRIKAARGTRSQASVAAAVGSTPGELSRWERGLRPVSVETLLLLAFALDVAPGSLLPGAEEVYGG